MAENTRKHLLLAKLEGTYATDSSPTGAANTMLVENLDIVPHEAQFLEREFALVGFDSEQAIPYGTTVKVSFQIDLTNGTAGLATPPPFNMLLRACGLTEVIVASTLVSYVAVTSVFESVTLYGTKGNTRHIVTGARGTFRIVCDPGKLPKILFEFTGLYTPPADAGAPTPTWPGLVRPRPVNKENTVFSMSGQALVLHAFTFTQGGQLVHRDKPNLESVEIDNRQTSAAISVHQPALANFDAFARTVAMTETPVIFSHTVATGRTCNISLPAMQLKQPRYGADGNQRLVSWDGAINRPIGGGDSFNLYFT